MVHRFFIAFVCMLLQAFNARAQTTIFFQGFENASTTCTENWSYTGGNRNTETDRTGSYSARVGRLGENSTITFDPANVAGLTGVTLEVYHSVRSGSGPGMDTREGAVFLVSLNGGAYTVISGVSGTGDYSYAFSASSGGIANTCPSTYTTPNPFTYSVPAGTNTVSLRVISVGRNGSTCANFNTAMTAGTAFLFDRNDEGFYIDDVRLTTTATAIPGIWTGAVNTDWFNCGNWHNNIVPTASTNVTIDQTASNDCVVGTAGTGAAVCNNLTVSSGSGTNRSLTVQGNASLVCAGNAGISKTAGSGNLKLTVTGNAVFTCNNLTMTGSASGTENAQFENETATPLVTINGNLTINPGGVLDLTNAPDFGILHLKGNYANNGLESDFKQTGSTVSFEGVGTQTISTAGFNEVFANITVNKTGGTLNLSSTAEVENSVGFANGIVGSTASALLLFRDNATASGMSNASHVNGPVRKTGDDAFIFPVGNAGNFQPVAISAPALTTDHFTAQYFQTDPDPLYDDAAKDPSLDHISSCEYWVLDRTGGSSNVSVTLAWDAASCGVTDLDELHVARWNGSMWKDHGNGGTTGTTAAGTIVTSGAVTAFSPFTLASTTVNNPLPVALLSFNAVKKNDEVYASWITATEQNTLLHVLERSHDGYDFYSIGQLDAAGFSNSNRYYAFTDRHPLPQTGYYRLKTIDTDGSYSLSHVVAVSGQEEAALTIVGNGSGIAVSALAPATIHVFAANGQLVARFGIAAGETLQQNLLPGIYMVTAVSGKHVYTQKTAVTR